MIENELMRSALGVARVGLCILDADGHILVIGDDVPAKLGILPTALIGQHFRALLAPGLLLSAGSELFSIDAAEVSVEARMITERGSAKILLFQGRTLTRAENDHYRVISILDVTDFGVTRDRFMELRRQLDALNSGVVVVDARKPDLPIAFVNKKFEQTTGYPASFAIGRNCRFLQGDGSRDHAVEKLGKAIEARHACHVVLKNVRRDGSTFMNELYMSPVFDDQGELTYFVGLQQEFTGRATLSGVDNLFAN